MLPSPAEAADSGNLLRAQDGHTEQSDADIGVTSKFGHMPQRRMTGQASLSVNPPLAGGAVDGSRSFADSRRSA